jgi:hypothetical protein
MNVYFPTIVYVMFHVYKEVPYICLNYHHEWRHSLHCVLCIIFISIDYVNICGSTMGEIKSFMMVPAFSE